MSAPTTAAPPPLFRLTGSADFDANIKALLTGPPKSGKTSFLGSVPNIVIADTEPEANNLQSIAHKNLPYVTVKGSADLQRLLFVLRDDSLRAQAAEQLGLPKIEAVGLDTLDTLQQILKKERLREQGTTKFQRDDWQWLKEEMVGIIKAFTSLPLHVIFTVHIKTQTIGSEEDQSTIYLPGLQGGIDEEIAGLVGYSFVTFRREEVRPDGSPYTRYLLRAEGNDTYSFVGNRAAGRLPDVIEPTFQGVYEAAMAARAAITNPVQQPTMSVVGSAQPAPAALPAAPPAAPAAPPAPAPAATQPAPAATQEVAQNPGQSPVPAPAPAAPVQTPVQTPPAQQEAAPAAAAATPAGQPADGKPGDDEPINPAAIGFCKRVFEACGLEFPEAIIGAMTLGEARKLVAMWQAIQQDATEGKLDKSPADEMSGFLAAMGWIAPADKARVEAGESAPPPPAAPVADVNGTIEQVMAYVGDDLARAQQAYDLEMGRPKPRATLVNALTNKGVTVQTGVQNPPPAPPAEAPAAPAEPAAAPPAPPVTPEAPTAEDQKADQQEQQAAALLQNELGAVPINEDGSVKGCEECGGVVDDEDIAVLSQSRFGRRLCVADYIAETKKPH